MNWGIRKLTIGLATVASLLMVVPVEAQRSGPPMGRRQGQEAREQLEQRIRAQMGQIMKERLELDDEQLARLGAVISEFDEQRQGLRREERAIRSRVEALMLEGGDDNDEALALVQRQSALRLREAEVFAAEQESLLEVLTPLQLFQFHAIREQIGERIRRLRQSGRGGGALPGMLPVAGRDTGWA